MECVLAHDSHEPVSRVPSWYFKGTALQLQSSVLPCGCVPAAVETPANTSEVKTTDYQSEKSHSREEKTTMQNGHPGESEFRSPGNGEESSSGAHHDVEALK